MELDRALEWLQATPIATTIRENETLFPWIESFHVLALVMVVGTISIVDLRLIGVASLDRRVERLMREVLPLTWGAFALAAVTGSLLFSSNAVNYGHNFYFRGKVILLALAGINMAVFHLLIGRDVARWSAQGRPPLAARAAGAVSLCLWVSVVACGRWIGFTLEH